jgi:hypothetical protein
VCLQLSFFNKTLLNDISLLISFSLSVRNMYTYKHINTSKGLNSSALKMITHSASNPEKPIAISSLVLLFPNQKHTNHMLGLADRYKRSIINIHVHLHCIYNADTAIASNEKLSKMHCINSSTALICGSSSLNWRFRGFLLRSQLVVVVGGGGGKR